VEVQQQCTDDDKEEVKDVPTCHTASRGEACYKHVKWAMETGVKIRPEWYPGLDENSKFEDFQGHIHTLPGDKCPFPCPAWPSLLCHTARPGESCHQHVSWAMQVGIKAVPQHYPSTLTEESSFEDFQAWMYRGHHGNCLHPCMSTVRQCHDSCVMDFVAAGGCEALHHNEDQEMPPEFDIVRKLGGVCTFPECSQRLFSVCYPEVASGNCTRCADEFRRAGGCEAVAKSGNEETLQRIVEFVPEGCVPCGDKAVRRCADLDVH